MRILRLTLENIKAYQSASFEFHPGINFISGKNGIGKSTIFESIGLVLFNNLEYKQDDFIRYGEKKAVIKLWFIPADERIYCIVRHLGTSKKYYILDEQSGIELDLHGIEDVQNWLKANLGEKIELTLKELFSQIVGVYQGRFTEPFMGPAEEKKTHFNKLLQIDKYKRACESSSRYESFFEKEIQDKQTAIELALKDIAFLNEKECELRENVSRLQALMAASEALQQQQQSATQNFDFLQEQQARIEHLTQHLEMISLQITNLQTLGSARQHDVSQAQQAMQICDQNRDVFEQTQRSREQLQVLVTDYNRYKQNADQLSQWNIQLQGLTTSRELLATQVERTGQKLSILHATLASTKVDHDIQFAAAIDAFNVAEAHLSQMKKNSYRLDSDLKRRDLIVRLIDQSRQGFQKIRQLSQLVAELSVDINRLQVLASWEAEQDKLTQQKNELDMRLAANQGRFQEYDRFRSDLLEARCPLFNSTCLNLQQDPTFSFQGLQQALQDENLHLEVERQELAKKLDMADRFLAEYRSITLLQAKVTDLINEKSTLFQDLESLPLLSQVQDFFQCFSLADEKGLIEQLARFYRTIRQDSDPACLDTVAQEIESWVARLRASDLQALSHATETREFTSAELKRLRQIRDEFDRQQLQLNREKADLVVDQQHLSTQQTELQHLRARIEDLVGLQQQLQPIADQFDQLTDFVSQHQTQCEHYLQHMSLAAKLSVFQDDLNQNNHMIRTLQSDQAEAAMSLAKVNAEFNPLHLLQVKAHLDGLREQLVASTTQMQWLEARNGLLRADLLQLSVLDQQINQLQSDIHQIQSRLKVVSTSRKILARVGEPIAAMFRQKISRIAENLYHRIADQQLRLVWGDGYEVSLYDRFGDRERQRSFNQLSGGEQMSVALSIRMAMIQYFSSLRIAFFDEPTTNLDEGRRQNLAQILPQICQGFDQVFLISHDDTFDAITDNVLSLS